MEGFLGETLVDVATHPKFSAYSPSDWVMLFITKYGQIDGSHRKTGVLDQVSRIPKGTPVVVTQARWANGQEEYRYDLGEPSQAYLDWREKMLGREANGTPQYGCDEGIAP
jgi:hypothetical protein